MTATGLVPTIAAAIALAAAACSTPQSSPPAATTAEATPPAAVAPAQSAPSPQPLPVAAAPAPAPVPPPAPKPKPKVAELSAGLPITIRTTRALSSKTMKSGDAFSAILEEPIAVGNWVVAPAGAKVDGRVAGSDKGGRLKGKASLALELVTLTTGDGQKIEIVTSPAGAEAAANKSSDVKKIGVGAGAGAAVGAIAGGGKGAAVGALIGGGAGAALRGDAAEIPAETVMTFELRSPVTIHERQR